MEKSTRQEAGLTGCIGSEGQCPRHSKMLAEGPLLHRRADQIRAVRAALSVSRARCSRNIWHCIEGAITGGDPRAARQRRRAYPSPRPHR